MPQSNLEQLQNAGCILPDADLTSAEIKVIEGLSPREVKTLIDIRERLQQAAASEVTAFTATDPLTPNIIL